LGPGLRRDDLADGHLGQNFTVEGMPDDEVCVGDRYRIGSALFEVTQPRVTCFKIGLRLEEPRMLALMYSHGRPGFYLRVLEEGDELAALVGTDDVGARPRAGGRPGQRVPPFPGRPGRAALRAHDGVAHRLRKASTRRRNSSLP
jgi:hypothetical protein